MTKYRILKDGSEVINWDTEYYNILNDGFESFCELNSQKFFLLQKLISSQEWSIASRYHPPNMFPHEKIAYDAMIEEFKQKYKKGFFEDINTYIRNTAMKDIGIFVSLWGNNLIGLRNNLTGEDYLPTNTDSKMFQEFFDNL